MDHLNKLVCKNLVIDLPNLSFGKKRLWLCDACQMGKQVRASFKAEKYYFYKSTFITFAHGSFGPSKTKCFVGNLYAFVVVDYYS